MQAADFLKGIKDPASLEKSSLAELQKLVEDFPYFQSGHLLLSLAAKKWDASVYQQSLKKTAIVASNRSHLFKLINELENVRVAPVTETKKETGAIIETVDSKKELEQLKAVEVAAEEAEAEMVKSRPEPEAELEREIGNQVVNSFVEKEILKTPELHKAPLPKEEPESFGDWLNFLKKNNGQSYQNIEEEVNKAKEKKEEKQRAEAENTEKPSGRKKRNLEIIDKIIEKNPGMIRGKEEQKFYAPDLKAKESLLENEHLVTETLARIYALQGNVNKAVRAYEILSLKYPQKSAYFASLIQKLKSNQ